LGCNVRARVGPDFDFYKAMGDLEAFTEKWAYEGIVCSAKRQQLVFGRAFSISPVCREIRYDFIFMYFY